MEMQVDIDGMDAQQRQQRITLKSQWQSLLKNNPQLRIRNAAEQLNVSEAELLCTGLGDSVFRLNPQFAKLLVDLEKVGSVMALSRNNQMVHEKHGVYQGFVVRGNGAMGLCLGDMDLRVFLNEWQYGFVVTEPTESGVRSSLQFFDREGTAIHKIYKTNATDAEAWDRLIAKYISDNQCVSLTLVKLPAPEYPNNGKAEAQEVIGKWESLKDVHQFHGMLRRLGISRVEALRLAGKEYANQLNTTAFEAALTSASTNKVPLMLFANNRGIVQIHTGILQKLLRTGPWLNVLDPDFNLHANTDQIAMVWLVRRPSIDGTITSLEVYNGNEELVLTLFGERKPSQSERQDWQALTGHLERTQGAS